jgi:hypothetical protein
VGKVTLKCNADEALSNGFFQKSNANKTLNRCFLKSKDANTVLTLNTKKKNCSEEAMKC